MDKNNRNKQYLWGVERGRCVMIITSLPSLRLLPGQCKIFKISKNYKPSHSVEETTLFFSYMYKYPVQKTEINGRGDTFWNLALRSNEFIFSLAPLVLTSPIQALFDWHSKCGEISVQFLRVCRWPYRSYITLRLDLLSCSWSDTYELLAKISFRTYWK